MSPPAEIKLPSGSRVSALARPRREKDQGIGRRGEDSDEESENRRPEAEEGGDHGEQFDVAEAQAFAVAKSLIDPADDQEQHAGGSDDGGDAAEDEGLGAGEEDVAVSRMSCRDCSCGAGAWC